VTTKREASMEALAIARGIADHWGEPDEATIWVLRLLWLAGALNPQAIEHPAYRKLSSFDGDDRRAKLRRVIEHPQTPAHEREAAVRALARIRA
jgi:hypothetical protein